MRNTKTAGDKSKTVAEIPAACSDEMLAVEFMERQRWSDCPACPHCGSVGVYQMKDRAGNRSSRYLWRCRDCNKQFTVRVGTVLEDSPIPLRHWCFAFWAACASKKGVSALQIKRQTGLSYKSALFLMHRIRLAMTDDTMPRLGGTVEVDETYVGGKPRYHGYCNVGRMGRGTRKAPVLAMVERGGRVRAMTVASVSPSNLKAELERCVVPEARLVTDEFATYKQIGEGFKQHDTVTHSKREYVRGDVHTNTAEGFFSILKRGMHGTFHAVSRKHLHRYVSEFQFKYNTRQVDDGARTIEAIRGADGKRLTYRQQVGR